MRLVALGVMFAASLSAGRSCSTPQSLFPLGVTLRSRVYIPGGSRDSVYGMLVSYILL